MLSNRFEMHLFLYVRLVGMVLGMATLLAGNAVATPVLFAFPAIDLETTTLTGARELARDHAAADARAVVPQATAHRATHTQTTPVPTPAPSQWRCPRPSLNCGCIACCAYFTAHFVMLAASNDIPLFAFPRRFTPAVVAYAPSSWYERPPCPPPKPV